MAIGEVKPQEDDDEDCEIIEKSPSATPTANPRESRENTKIPRFSETPEKTPETPDPLVVTLKAVEKMRILFN
jgi:hypothetical protein